MNAENPENRKSIGKYPLKKILGKGGMGEVWLSHHPGLDIPVAVKVLRTGDENSRKRFIQEGKLAATINHQNIVRVFDAGSDGNDFYLVMEFIEGEDYRSFADKQGGVLGIDAVLEMGLEISKALNVAHDKRVLHRDIKPENILRSFKGEIKLTDLGIAKLEDSQFGNTMENSALGTPYYISPEQAKDASSVDCRTDIYSLGATLYRLLTGTYPFKAKTPIQMLMKHISEPLEKPEIRNANIPPELSKIICKMMEKDKAQRYENCTEVIKELEGFRMYYSKNSIEDECLSETMGATLDVGMDVTMDDATLGASMDLTVDVARGAAPIDSLESNEAKLGLSNVSLYTKSGKGLHIYCHDVTIGRSRKADIMTRNYPLGSSYSQEDLKLINVKLSSIHAKIKIERNAFVFEDASSRNGSEIGGSRVTEPRRLEESGQIVLAPRTDSSLSLKYNNLNNQALILERTDSLNDSYIIVIGTFNISDYLGTDSGLTAKAGPQGLIFLKNGVISEIENFNDQYREVYIPVKQLK
ncbi:MAG: protein kinase [Lentisphaeraceae bacterium]|nr:protein kinase [Lentisphaeraceae bacterium]